MISTEKQEVLRLFGEGRELYKQRDFAAAKRRFAQALKIDTYDGPSALYYRRCEHFIQGPPPPEWDGVFTLKTK